MVGEYTEVDEVKKKGKKTGIGRESSNIRYWDRESLVPIEQLEDLVK